MQETWVRRSIKILLKKLIQKSSSCSCSSTKLYREMDHQKNSRNRMRFQIYYALHNSLYDMYQETSSEAKNILLPSNILSAMLEYASPQ